MAAEAALLRTVISSAEGWFQMFLSSQGKTLLVEPALYLASSLEDGSSGLLVTFYRLFCLNKFISLVVETGLLLDRLLMAD